MHNLTIQCTFMSLAAVFRVLVHKDCKLKLDAMQVLLFYSILPYSDHLQLAEAYVTVE
jgi:hypothetical protein